MFDDVPSKTQFHLHFRPMIYQTVVEKK